MASFNKVLLVGNLTRDPEMRALAAGGQMARLGLAVNRRWTDKEGAKREEANFFNLVAYDKQAETLGKFAKKGNRMLIDGALSARTVTNDKGEHRTFHDIRVRDFQFLDSAPKDGGKPQPSPVDDEEDVEDDD